MKTPFVIAPEDPIELTPADKSTLKAIDFTLAELLDDLEQIGIRYSAVTGKDAVPYLCPEGNNFFDALQSQLEAQREQIKSVIAQSIEYGEAATSPV